MIRKWNKMIGCDNDLLRLFVLNVSLETINFKKCKQSNKTEQKRSGSFKFRKNNKVFFCLLINLNYLQKLRRGQILNF